MQVFITSAEKLKHIDRKKEILYTSKYGMDTSDFNFNKVPEVLKGFEPQTLKSELGKIRDVLGEIQTEMHRSLEKNAPMKNREQER